MNGMLLNSFNRAYWSIGMILYATFLATSVTSLEVFSLYCVSFATFLITGIAMSLSYKQENSFFSKKNLAFTTFSCSLLSIALFELLSYGIDGDTFVFSKRDAILYYTESIKMAKMPIAEAIHYLCNDIGYGFDDWGAFFCISFIFRIIPSHVFLSVIYCVIGTFSALMIFDICKNFMSRRYSYMAALLFSISSFMTMHYAKCVKETILLCIIIASFNCFITYIRRKKIKYLGLTLLFAFFVFFFRVPTALLLLFSFGLSFVLLYLKGPIAIAFAVILILLICATPLFTYTYKRYLRDGDTEKIIERKNELAKGGGIVNQLADPVAALAGPFPSVQIKTIKPTPLYASGLLFRFLLSIPFFMGVYFVFKNRHIKMYPLVIFYLTNAIGVAISVKGLETRSSMPHLAMMYIVAFWFLAKYDYEQLPWKIPQKAIYGCFIGIMILCFLWNLR